MDSNCHAYRQYYNNVFRRILRKENAAGGTEKTPSCSSFSINQDKQNRAKVKKILIVLGLFVTSVLVSALLLFNEVGNMFDDIEIGDDL